MADLAALVDRLAIEEVLTRYAWALDSKSFDGLDEVFTADAHIDYTSSGGVAGPFPEVKAWLARVLPNFPAYQHLVTNHQITVDGDRATSRAEFYNPMVTAKPDGSRGIFFVGGEYHDQLVRTPGGWRISERIEKSVWTDGELPAAPPT
jgi:3-phenylpropionate/cinnamic acid dioxygenase small subunit